jgi:poly(U)-specific endoribonuclease
LLTVDPAAYQVGTIKLLADLFDNYVPAVCIAETSTSAETTELDAFLNAVFDTPVMQRTQEFLASKGLPNGRAAFEQIWVEQYSRCSGTLGSSGLEHILLAELNSGVSGFHNWVFFAKGEENGDVNYRGYMDTVDFGTVSLILT